MRLSPFVVAAALCLLACSTPPEDSGRGSAEAEREAFDREARAKAAREATRRDVTELPFDLRLLWTAYTERDGAYPKLKEEALENPRHARFLVENLIGEVLAGFQRLALTPEPDARFVRAQAELVSIGEPATAALCELMALGNGAPPRLAGDLLAEIGRPAVLATVQLLERTDGRNPEVARRRAAALLARLPFALEDEPVVKQALIRRLETDSEWQVRKLAAEALAARGARDVEVRTTRLALEKALRDEDRDVSRAAVRGLARLEDPDAMPALIDHLADATAAGNLLSMREADKALQALSGEKHKDLRAWRAWWRDVGAGRR